MGLIRIGWLGALTLVATTPAIHAQMASTWAEQAAADPCAPAPDSLEARNDPSDSDTQEDSPEFIPPASPDVWHGVGSSRSETAMTGSALVADLVGDAADVTLPAPLPESHEPLLEAEEVVCPAHVWISCRYAHAPPTAD